MSEIGAEDQLMLDQEGLCDVARLLIAALQERDKAQAEEAACHRKMQESKKASHDQRAALDALMLEFRDQLPAAEELPGRLARLRAARAEELRLHQVEADDCLAHLDANRRVMKARMRAIELIDGLDQNPLIDYALAQAREASASAQAPEIVSHPKDMSAAALEAGAVQEERPAPPPATEAEPVAAPTKAGRGRKKKGANP